MKFRNVPVGVEVMEASPVPTLGEIFSSEAIKVEVVER